MASILSQPQYVNIDYVLIKASLNDIDIASAKIFMILINWKPLWY